MANRYELRIDEDTKKGFVELAAVLGYVCQKPGNRFGDPSTPQFIEALVNAWRRDPALVGAELADLLSSPLRPPA